MADDFSLVDGNQRQRQITVGAQFFYTTRLAPVTIGHVSEGRCCEGINYVMIVGGFWSDLHVF
jgi:hypothetical protein